MQEEKEKTEQDKRKTGKELFMEGIKEIEFDEDQLEQIIQKEEETKEEGDDEEEEDEDDGVPVAPLYDKDLFAQELAEMEERGEDIEDVDFD